jgi:hypothetical protein
MATTTQQTGAALVERLRNTPGGCGLLIYDQIQASAPCMGLVAAAFLWSEVFRFLSGARDQIRGSATIWSPIIPPFREVLSREKVEIGD